MYRGVALALGLLITPAIAETYTAKECDTIETALFYGGCGPTTTDSMAARFSEIRKHHRNWALSPKYKSGYSPTEEAFVALAKQVCDGKITAQDALRGYCPNWRPEQPLNAAFPSEIDPKYSEETPAEARLHTCSDQYNRNKEANANGGLNWIERGGGYYSECNRRLGGLSPGLPPLREGSGGSLKGEAPEGDKMMARSVTYTIQKFRSTDADEAAQSLECLYRNQERLLCPATDWIRFDKHYRTKDYDLLVVFTGDFGSGNRWHDWKLIVEDGKQALIKPLAENCLACDIRAEKLDFQSNEVVFTHRQAKQLHTATFRNGQLTLRKSKLDPHEPLDENTCDFFMGIYDDCKSYKLDPKSCSMPLSNAGHFGLLRAEDSYAGISYDGMWQKCKASCSSGEAMDRKTFMRKVCRR